MLKGWSFIKLIIFTVSSRVFISEAGLKNVFFTEFLAVTSITMTYTLVLPLPWSCHGSSSFTYSHFCTISKADVNTLERENHILLVLLKYFWGHRLFKWFYSFSRSVNHSLRTAHVVVLRHRAHSDASGSA